MIDWASVRYFKEFEFLCRCCGQSRIQPGLVYALDEVRHEFGKPMVVTSGYRCPEHNKRVSSTGANGPHTTGLAADIAVTGRDAYTLLRIAYSKSFTGIGINQKGAGRFLHLDMIPDSFSHRRPWIWSY